MKSEVLYTYCKNLYRKMSFPIHIVLDLNRGYAGQPHKKSKGKEMFKISQIPIRLMTFSSHTGLRRLITA
jgi:hypothetical protein